MDVCGVCTHTYIADTCANIRRILPQCTLTTARRESDMTGKEWCIRALVCRLVTLIILQVSNYIALSSEGVWCIELGGSSITCHVSTTFVGSKLCDWSIPRIFEVGPKYKPMWITTNSQWTIHQNFPSLSLTHIYWPAASEVGILIDWFVRVLDNWRRRGDCTIYLS